MSTYKAGTIWISGITASGKTTLGKKLYEKLILKYNVENVILFDGEEFRKHLKRNYGFSSEERFKVVKESVKVISNYLRDNKIVIVCTISHKREMRDYARGILKNFLEIYLKCPINVCADRDYKNHYKRAFAGEYEMFVGVSEPYEESFEPDLTVDTSKNSINKCTNIIYNKTLDFLIK